MDSKLIQNHSRTMFFHVLLLLPLISFINAHSSPNFVIVLTDDQDLLLDGLTPMAKTLDLVGTNGKTFKNAFVNTPVCCPSRSTILTGKYAHNTGVVNNSISGNCCSTEWQTYHESYSIAALLQGSKNYTTFYGGKYMNEYGYEASGGISHIPKGYDWWIGLQGNSRYYNYTLSVNGTGYFYEDTYLTDLLANHSIDFLTNKLTERPFFMMVATPASHAPFTPAERHKNKFPDVKAIRTPSFNYTPTNKHWLVQMPPTHLPANVSILDDVQRHRQQTLLAVDEMVERIVKKLEELNELNDTYIMFTSDHGFHIGQFTQPWDKREPYETDIRVPMIIRGPNIPLNKKESFPVTAVDIAPTILDLAGVEVPSFMDGSSFKEQLFASDDNSFAKRIFIEYWGEGDSSRVELGCPWKYDHNLTECVVDQWCKCQDAKNNTYSCVLTLSKSQNFKFCTFRDTEHFHEAYNLTVDRYELDNIYDALDEKVIEEYSMLLDNFQSCQGNGCLTDI